MDKKVLGDLSSKNDFTLAKTGPVQAYLYYSDAAFQRDGYFTAKVPDGNGMKEVKFTEWTSTPDKDAGRLVWNGASSDVKEQKPFLNRGATADLRF